MPEIDEDPAEKIIRSAQRAEIERAAQETERAIVGPDPVINKLVQGILADDARHSAEVERLEHALQLCYNRLFYYRFGMVDLHNPTIARRLDDEALDAAAKLLDTIPARQ